MKHLFFAVFLGLSAMLAGCSSDSEREAADASFTLSSGVVTASFVHVPVHEAAVLISDRANIVVRLDSQVEGEVHAAVSDKPLAEALKTIFKDYNATIIFDTAHGQRVRELVLLNEGAMQLHANSATLIAPARSSSLLAQTARNRQAAQSQGQRFGRADAGNPALAQRAAAAGAEVARYEQVQAQLRNRLAAIEQAASEERPGDQTGEIKARLQRVEQQLERAKRTARMQAQYLAQAGVANRSAGYVGEKRGER